MKKEEYLRIRVDKREQLPYTFLGSRYPDVIVVKKSLDVGDYSLDGWEHDLFIERKTCADFISSITQGRERFEREMERVSQVFRYLLIEMNLSDVLLGNYRSGADPHSVIATIMSWQIRFTLTTMFVGDRAQGETAVYWLCREYRRNRQLKRI